MKPRLLVALFLFLVVSCQKQVDSKHSDKFYVKNVKKALSDSLLNNDFVSLDFSQAIITSPDRAVKYLQIPFKGISMSEKFVLIKTNSNGDVFRGFIIKLKEDALENNRRYVYNGFIEISSLGGTENVKSKIINGYISAFHTEGTELRSLVVPSEANVLPAVVVTCYVPAEGGGKGGGYSGWINLMSFFGGGSSGFYSSIDDSRGGGGGYNGGEDGNSYNSYYEGYSDAVEDENTGIRKGRSVYIDFEPVENLSPIDISKYLKCFSNLPDAGSQCSIEILSDIPVDKDPNNLLNWKTGSPGHTFLQLKKMNGNKIVMQNIGFYPVQGWKTILTNAPIAGKFADNGVHEFNASLKMNLSPEQFKKTIDRMIELSRYVKYDIDEYNCTDFALDVFNTTRVSNPLEIPKYNIPGGLTANGTSTPQGLYNRLVSMQQAGAENPNITIPGHKGFVAESDGPCN